MKKLWILGVIVTVILIAVFIIVNIFSSSFEVADNESQNESQILNFSENQKPILNNLGVLIPEAFDYSAAMEDNISKIFLEFGVVINGSQGLKTLPEITYIVPAQTKVYSPVSGVVERVEVLYSGDYHIAFKTNLESEYIISLEHVVNVQVEEGESVKAGDYVGDVSNFLGHDNYYATEIAVWIGGETVTKYCPFDFLNESLKVEYEKKFNDLADSWEEFYGEKVYDRDNWTSPGCLKDVVYE